MNLRVTHPYRSFLLVSVICLSTASCANDDNGNNAASNTVTENTVVETATIEDTDEITNQIAHGEETHSNHCYKCHTDDVYKREDRFVKSIDALSKQVVRCKDGTGAPWFDEDTDAVVQFLNKKYYRF